MLLLHQVGSVKIGEIVRYTVTYTPANDRILPSPATLHLRIKNTSAIALRAAFIHGPYTLHVSASPANFQPNEKFENPRKYGVPEFEPNLKAGGTFYTQLLVPEDIRETAGSAHSRSHDEPVPSISWIIEVTSQVVFSNSAAVHYEITLGRDEKSLSLGFGSSGAPAPGQVHDHQQSKGAKDGHHPAQQKGIYSKALSLLVEDTAALWNTPVFPEWDKHGRDKPNDIKSDNPVEDATGAGEQTGGQQENRRQKKVHLVVLTHGLHSNLGADMLYLKESIDATAKQAKIEAKARKRGRKRSHSLDRDIKTRTESNDGAQTEHPEGSAPADNIEDPEPEDDDEEETIVRGFSGNAVRTEKGIKYLGKRLARYVLSMTYPDQPFRPVSKAVAKQAVSSALGHDAPNEEGRHLATHEHILNIPSKEPKLAYKITSISFIGHSLGGLIQTYAVAYIQKHSPQFFDLIEPINFIALASPFLGLSNENPIYVKFALDFGLVGRTGQDLGLTWRAPTIARSGWNAIVSGLEGGALKSPDPGAKPLLRILPTGPAHTVLKKFRNRTVYSNVVNDGIVPLRTSCLLFLDWQGLGRVEKARRENGLVGTMASWGWGELIGANSSSPSRNRVWSDSTSSHESQEEGADTNIQSQAGDAAEVPQPPPDATVNDDTASLKAVRSIEDSSPPRGTADSLGSPASTTTSSTTDNGGPFSSLLGLFRSKPNKSSTSHNHRPKHKKIYKRSQTLKIQDDSSDSNSQERSKATAGDDHNDDPDNLDAPPKTTFFESAGDLLAPPLPPIEFLINPASRPRTIFHDRVYHPEDIPPPPMKPRKPAPLARRMSGSSTPESPYPSVHHQDSELSAKDYDDTVHTNPDKDSREVIDSSAMKVEEKIARAYHRDLSWRKVLVRLEPDAHNNIIVRRRFANAFGWPVVKHLVDTHFSNDAVATTRDEDERGQERAKAEHENPNEQGDEIKPEQRGEHPEMFYKERRTDSEHREAGDTVSALPKQQPGSLAKALAQSRGEQPPRPIQRQDSATWSDRDFADSADESDSDMDVDSGKPVKKAAEKRSSWSWTEVIAGKGEKKGTDKAEIDKFLSKGPVAGLDGAGLDGNGGTSSSLNFATLVPPADSTAVGLAPARKSLEDQHVSEQVARMSLGKKDV